MDPLKSNPTKSFKKEKKDVLTYTSFSTPTSALKNCTRPPSPPNRPIKRSLLIEFETSFTNTQELEKDVEDWSMDLNPPKIVRDRTRNLVKWVGVKVKKD